MSGKVNIRLRPPDYQSLSELFHTNTKYHPFHFRQWEKPRVSFADDPVIAQWMQSPFKEYLSAQKIPLPIPSELTMSAGEALVKPDGDTPFGKEKLHVEELSSLLYFSAGVTKEGRRPFPSADCLYPLEIYAAIPDATGCEPGLYHYNAKHHLLEFLFETEASLKESIPKKMEEAGAVFFISSVFERTSLKYGDRGYRYALIETGHLVQNMVIAAKALHLLAIATGEFMDDRINALLGLDGVEEAVLFLVATGKTR